MSSANNLRQADRSALIAQANQLTGQQRFAEAVPVLKRLSELEPKTADVWAALGLAYAGSDQIAPAIDACRMAFRFTTGQLGGILLNLVTLLTARGHAAALASAFLNAYRAGLKDVTTFAALLDVLSASDGAETRQILMDAVAHHPSVGKFHRALALEYEAANRIDDAIAAGRTAVALMPDDFSVRLHFAVVLKKGGRYDEAIVVLRALANADFGRSAPHAELYECLNSAYVEERRIGEIERMLAESPRDDAIRYQLGRALLERRAVDEGLRVLGELSAAVQGAPASKELIARYRLLQGDTKAPIALYHSIWDEIAAHPPKTPPRRAVPARRDLPVNPVIYMPVEIAQRELAGRVLMACYAAQHGLMSVLGPAKSMCRGETAVALPPGIYVEKTLYRLDWEKVVSAFPGGHRFTAIDEEAMGRTGTDREMLLTIDPAILPLLDMIFISGPRHQEAYRKVHPEYVGRIRATGNPRIDLLDRRYLASLREEVDAIRAKHGDFVLVCTNFSTINSKVFQFSDAVQNFFNVVRKEDPSEFKEVLRIAKDAVRAECEYLLAFETVMPILLRQMPDLKFVIRGHPTESTSQWRNLVASAPNVVLDSSGSLQASMAAARSMLYIAGCATGLEACIANEPAVRFAVGPDLQFPKAGLSFYCNEAGTTAQELVDALRRVDRKSGARLARRPEDERLIAEYFTLADEPAASRIAASLAELYDQHGRGGDVNANWLTRSIRDVLTKAAEQTARGMRHNVFAAVKRVTVTPDEVRRLIAVGREAFGFPDNVEVSALSEESVLICPSEKA